MASVTYYIAAHYAQADEDLWLATATVEGHNIAIHAGTLDDAKVVLHKAIQASLEGVKDVLIEDVVEDQSGD